MPKLTTVDADSVNPFSQGILGQITEFFTGMKGEFALGNGEAYSQLYSYVSVYAGFGMLSAIVGLMAIAISPGIKKLMGKVH